MEGKGRIKHSEKWRKEAQNLDGQTLRDKSKKKKKDNNEQQKWEFFKSEINCFLLFSVFLVLLPPYSSLLICRPAGSENNSSKTERWKKNYKKMFGSKEEKKRFWDKRSTDTAHRHCLYIDFCFFNMSVKNRWKQVRMRTPWEGEWARGSAWSEETPTIPGFLYQGKNQRRAPLQQPACAVMLHGLI